MLSLDVNWSVGRGSQDLKSIIPTFIVRMEETAIDALIHGSIGEMDAEIP